LNIHGDDFAVRADFSRDGDGQPAGATAQIQYRHARSDIQALDDGRRAIGFRKWIVELDQPAQGCRTGNRPTTGRKPP
jgi:hypothetical protein